MAEITVKIDDKQVFNLLATMKRQGLNMKTPFRQASFIAHSDVIKRFTDESDEKGAKWKPLSPVTIMMRMRRRKKSKSVGILKDTGRLRQSIRPSSNAYGAEVKTNVKYAAIHNFGGMTGRGRKVRIPARPYMNGISQEATGKIVNLFKIHLFNKRD